MLFQASAEKSEPTCTTARITSRFTSTVGPPTPTCTGCSELHPAFCQNSLHRAEVGLPGRGVASHGEGEQISAGQRKALAEVKTFWISAPSLTPKIFTTARKTTMAMPVKIGRADADLHIAQHHRADRKRRHMGNVPEPMRRRDRRKKDAEKLAKGHATAAMVPV